MSKKIDFIICYNNELYKEECIEYINELFVPRDVEVGIITIDDALSMTEGYNRAMTQSDAKYKVYLHQDVFIINNMFIEDVIRLFETNPDVGMMGVLGKKEIAENACYWNQWNTGRTYAMMPLAFMDIEYLNNKLEYVEAIDGMIMITQYDVKWRDDCFEAFDYYDISQSEEMKKNGYKIAVPYQKTPWCIHVCGISKITRYEYYRKIFCREYSGNGYSFNESVEQNCRIEKEEIAKKYYEMTVNAFESCNDSLFDYLMENSEPILDYSTNQQILFLYWEAYLKNISQIEKGILFENRNVKKLIEIYTILNFICLRNKLEKSTCKQEKKICEDDKRAFKPLYNRIGQISFLKI